MKTEEEIKEAMHWINSVSRAEPLVIGLQGALSWVIGGTLSDEVQDIINKAKESYCKPSSKTCST